MVLGSNGRGFHCRSNSKFLSVVFRSVSAQGPLIAAAEEGIPVAHHMGTAAVGTAAVDRIVVGKVAVDRIVVGTAAVGTAAVYRIVVGKIAADIHSHRDLDMLVVVVHRD